MGNSLDKTLAEATARSAANTAKQNPDNQRMQELAKQYEQRAQSTK